MTRENILFLEKKTNYTKLGIVRDRIFFEENNTKMGIVKENVTKNIIFGGKQYKQGIVRENVLFWRKTKQNWVLSEKISQRIFFFLQN